ncbi:X-ray repair cross-complementing protein 5-like [Argopecten irradians]|uniref:X-ray repair cross-complementing protein 5-like n=1 Tax=Argopecten irradians TaxID=31199 RepID=UPI003714C762
MIDEAIAIVVDVGPSMNQAPAGETTSLQTAIEAMTMIVQRKVFAESKDEIAVILFGTADTDNPLADGDSYENITILRPLGVADFDLLNIIQNDIQASNISADSSLHSGSSENVSIATYSSLENSQGSGPSLDDDDDNDSEKPGPSTMSNGHRKERTAQQRAGEAMLRHILQEVDGECYSFNEALPALSNFQSRQIKQTAWKCQLEITSGIRIPICSYVKLKDFKLKQSWKNVYAKDPSEEVGNLRTYHMKDEEETEIDREDMIEGHCYGNTLVPMSEDDKANMKYKAEKCFKILGFTKPENVKRHHYLGDGSSCVVADKGDEAAAVALSSLIQALYETNMVAIVRKVYSAASGPKLGCLIPHIKAEYECFLYVEIPFMEDIRQFTFGSLPISKENVSAGNTKFVPSEKQLEAVDNLITSMDLCQSQDNDDDEEETTEFLKAKLTFNPHFQRLYQCLQHRGLNPDEPLAELSPLVANYLKPPQEVLTKCEEHLDSMKKLFKLEVVKQKEEKTGENQFKESDEGEATKAKKPRLDDDLEGGMADITRAKVTEVGTVTPVEDFVAFINQKDEDKFEEASEQMQKRIEQIVVDSFGSQFYPKAMDCLKALRLHSIKKAEPGLFNTFMKKFKDTLIAKGRRDFWEQVVTENQGLISKMESEDSNVTKEEAKAFVSEEEEKDEEPEKQETGDDADDLLDMM